MEKILGKLFPSCSAARNPGMLQYYSSFFYRYIICGEFFVSLLIAVTYSLRKRTLSIQQGIYEVSRGGISMAVIMPP